MRCSSGKISYASHALAELAMYQARAYGNDNRKAPVRVYECSECGRYHLTSKENRHESSHNSGHVNSTE